MIMKKITKIAALAAMLAVSAVAFVGCGEQDTQTSKPETSAVVSTADESSAAADDTSSTEAEDASIVGKWKVAYIVDAEGNQKTLEDYSKEQGVDTENVDTSMIFDLKEDGTGSCTMGGIGVDLTYTFDGSALTYTITGADGTEQTASFQYDADEDVLFYTDEATGMTSVLERNA